jgi:cell shape-determining protein MreD
MKTLFTLLLIFALILESTLTTIPLLLLMILVLTAVYKSNYIFILGLVFGLLIDLMTLRMIGVSSIFFSIMIFLVLLYQSKFEIATNTFIIFASILASFGYLLLMGYTHNIIFELLISVILALIMFRGLQRVNRIG